MAFLKISTAFLVFIALFGCSKEPDESVVALITEGFYKYHIKYKYKKFEDIEAGTAICVKTIEEVGFLPSWVGEQEHGLSDAVASMSENGKVVVSISGCKELLSRGD